MAPHSLSSPLKLNLSAYVPCIICEGRSKKVKGGKKKKINFFFSKQETQIIYWKGQGVLLDIIYWYDMLLQQITTRTSKQVRGIKKKEMVKKLK